MQPKKMQAAKQTAETGECIECFFHCIRIKFCEKADKPAHTPPPKHHTLQWEVGGLTQAPPPQTPDAMLSAILMCL